MDFIRAAAKAIFYDFPESEARRIVAGNYSFLDFQQTICELLAHGNMEYSRTETKRIWEFVRDNWILPNHDRTGQSQEFDATTPFNILTSLGEECLDISESYPKVRFEYLLRWRSISYLISEDLISIPTLALNDLKRGLRSRNSRFDWPDVLTHDNEIINKVIESGLADTHAHLYASSDVFMLNWISMMNNPKIMMQMASNLRIGEYMENRKWQMERDTVTVTGQKSYSFYHYGILAALCRAFLFSSVKKLLLTDSLYTSIITGIKDHSSLGFRVYDSINVLRMEGLKSAYGSVADYAITGLDNDYNSHYYILSGERKLLYDAFRIIFTKSDISGNTEKILFLYLTLKNRIRREMVQTNNIIGFENFQLYQDKKDLFLDNKMWSSINVAYAIHSSLGSKNQNFLEGRITPGSIKNLLKMSVCDPFSKWGDRETLRQSTAHKSVCDQFSIVVHFIKRPIPTNKPSRWEAQLRFRESLWRDTNLILKAHEKEKRIVGIDVAGSELNCRPEIFAPMFRWAKSQGIGNNMTFHAGEDYYDLIDGLRTIHEAITLMDFDSGCRIGHAIAIGKDAREYYHTRHYTIIAPAQIILDNFIWMKYFSIDQGIHLSQETLNFIDNATYDLFFKIGYEVINPLDYWHAMLMRGNDHEMLANKGRMGLKTRARTAQPLFWKSEHLSVTARALDLYRTYELDSMVYKNGLRPAQFKVKVSFNEDVEKIQIGIMKLLKTKGIAIEANPSSNLKIGGLDRYDKLPLFRFFPIDENNEERMLVSVNTDDRGVFATNLANEYSLVAAALMKQKDKQSGRPLYSITQIADYIRCLANNGKTTRFRNKT